jgi:Tol biopolymer transport system component
MLAEVTGQRLGGDTYPAFSPDGTMLAFCTGQHTLNSLAIIPTADLDAEPEILAYGSGFGIQAFCAQPHWSPNGSEIVFVYTALVTSFLGTELQSNLFTIPVDGGEPIQLTSYSGNQVVSRPTFSPDGQSIAYSVLTSSGDVFLLSDLIHQTYSSDIYAISLNKGSPGKGMATPIALTNDGHSLDPSWGIVTDAVDIQRSESLLESIQLFQNYPNPFATATHIEYRVQQPTHLRLAIYNLYGELVDLITDGVQFSGQYRIYWEGKDRAGNPLPGGIYILTCTADGHSLSRRMVLQR